MDVVSSGEVTHLVTNPSAFAVAVAVALGMMKLLEITVTALVKKYTKNDHPAIEVTFDSETTEKIREMSDKITQIHAVVEKIDNDGTPMVYSSRTGVESIRDIAVIIRNISQTQERLAHVMERLEQKFSDHDHQDILVQANTNMNIERLIKIFEEHDKRVMMAIQTQSEINSKLDNRK